MAIIKCVAIMVSGTVLCHPLLFLKEKKKKKRTVITYLVFYPFTSQCNDQENLLLYKHIYLSLNSKLYKHIYLSLNAKLFRVIKFIAKQ